LSPKLILYSGRVLLKEIPSKKNEKENHPRYLRRSFLQKEGKEGEHKEKESSKNGSHVDPR